MGNMDFLFQLVERGNDSIQQQLLLQQPENIIRVDIKRMVHTIWTKRYGNYLSLKIGAVILFESVWKPSRVTIKVSSVVQDTLVGMMVTILILFRHFLLLNRKLFDSSHQQIANRNDILQLRYAILRRLQIDKRY